MKSNEIFAVPFPMELLELKGAPVTSDPTGTQIKIADTIVRARRRLSARAEGKLAVLRANVETFFVDPAAQGRETFETKDAYELRIEMRRYVVCHDIQAVLSDGRYVAERVSQPPRSLSRSLKRSLTAAIPLNQPRSWYRQSGPSLSTPLPSCRAHDARHARYAFELGS